MPSRGIQPAPKWKTRSASGRSRETERPRLTDNDLKKLIDSIRDVYGWEPKDFQLEAIRAQIEGVDMIVQAPTGAGKTALAAGPHLWPGNEKKFTLMVCPLLSLEEEMVCLHSYHARTPP